MCGVQKYVGRASSYSYVAQLEVWSCGLTYQTHSFKCANSQVGVASTDLYDTLPVTCKLDKLLAVTLIKQLILAYIPPFVCVAIFYLL